MSSKVVRFAMTLAAAASLAAAPAFAQSTQTTGTTTTSRANLPAGTTVEFRTATRLPGITLEPGKYVFRLGDSIARQNIVEVYSADGSKKIATLLTVDYGTPAQSGVTTVTFDRSNPPALRAWYAPGVTVGREFVWSEDEARTLHTSANTPVLWAKWDPNDRTVIGSVNVQAVGQTIGQAARTVADVAKDIARGVADVAVDVWDNIEDNATLVNPTESRKAAERHLDAAEKAYSDLEERVNDDVETRLQPLGTTLEMLEDAFEKGQSWMGHYTAVMSSLDSLSPEKPVGTSGGGARLDASTNAALMNIREHLRAFHAQAMK